jgi:glycerol-3-phosphate dehydrogenase (NAD(P)+)
MGTITIVGAGMMGTALCWPLSDNGHEVRLVGTPLDDAIVQRIRQDGVHPKLQRPVPPGVRLFSHRELPAALENTEIIASGVSSFGVDWFIEAVGPHLRPGAVLIAVTKGLVVQPDGRLQILPHYIQSRLPAALQDQVSLNAIGGPCIAYELSARRQTAVVFCGSLPDVLERLRKVFATDYYHVQVSLDEIGVEVCAALKNAYALGIGMAIGQMEVAGPDGPAHMYNPQAALFSQSMSEMARFLALLGGEPRHLHGLPGPGDLYVTVFGGRTVRMGRLLGSGLSYPAARQHMAGETLESVEIITRVGAALPLLERSGLIQPTDFPLMRHLYAVIHASQPPEFPWDRFFA